MKLVIQRVNKATVRVEGKVIGRIGLGLFVLVGVGEADTKSTAEGLAEKVSRLRILSDNNDKMNLSVKDLNCQVLVVSQFTLYADTTAGNRPSFIKAAKPEKAREIYDYFVLKLKEMDLKVETGSFGDYMKIEAVLDGPVTIINGNF